MPLRPPLALALSLTVSLALHGALLLPDLVKRPSAAPPPARLQASLRVPSTPPAPPIVEPPVSEPESIEKDTLTPEQKPAAAPRQSEPPLKVAPHNTAVAGRKYVESAQRKLANVLVYPPEAVAQGQEGDVHLLIKLNDDGTIAEISVAASSGHPLLDSAAIKAAQRVRRFGAGPRELILPISFRLQ